MGNDKGQLLVCWGDKEVHGKTATWAAFRPKLDTLLEYLKKGMWGIKGIQDRDEAVSPHIPQRLLETSENTLV